MRINCKLSRLLVCLLLSLSLGCVYTPKVKDDGHSDDDGHTDHCKTIFKKMEVSETRYGVLGDVCSKTGGILSSACAFVGGAVATVVGAGTFILASSVKVVGNTIHWAEVSASCTDPEKRRDALDPKTLKEKAKKQN